MKKEFSEVKQMWKRKTEWRRNRVGVGVGADTKGKNGGKEKVKRGIKWKENLAQIN